SIRVDTLQLGIAPYKHDYNQIATWFVVQARQYTDDIHHGTELAALVRLFKGGAWIEAGITNGGRLQAMAMFNFLKRSSHEPPPYFTGCPSLARTSDGPRGHDSDACQWLGVRFLRPGHRKEAAKISGDR